MTTVSMSKIETMIYEIRGQRVLLDSDLANLYEVETRRLNEQVRRNLNRFPADFMFQLTPEEFQAIKDSGVGDQGRGGRQKLPYVFTENGVAMLSSVLNSERAIQVNISIMRIFTKLRSFLLMDDSLSKRMDRLETGTNKLFKIVFERMDAIEDSTPTIKPDRKKIGLTLKDPV